MLETHTIKIFVKIKKIKLVVRFPCRLIIQLKADNCEIQSRSSYQLKNGQCIVNESIVVQADVIYDIRSKQYQNNEIKIIVNMVSNNNMVNVGSTSFNPCNKEYQQQVEYYLPLEQSQDKSAKINFIQSYKLVNKSNNKANYNSLSIEKQSKDRSNQTLTNSYSSKTLVNNSIYRSPQQLQQKSVVSTQIGRINSPKHDFLSSKSKNSSLKNLAQNWAKFQENPYKEIDERQMTFSKQSQFPSIQTRKQILPSNGKVSEKQMLSRIKQLAIKKQISDKKEEVSRIIQQNEAKSVDLDYLKDKIKQMEKKQKQINLQLKQAREQGERRKNKYLQIEMLKNQSDVIIFTKQQQIKNLHFELRKSNEKNQQLNSQLKNQQKKYQLKENSYQQQLKKINDKCCIYESQRQKLTVQNYDLLVQIESSQKKRQTNVRQKDRNYGQEKNKFSKKIDQLATEVNTLSQQKDDLEKKLNEANTRLKKSIEEKTSVTAQLNILQEELLLTNILLKKQQDQLVNYERQIQSYKFIEQERDICRKKCNELMIQLNESKQKTQKLKTNLTNAERKVVEVQNQLMVRLKEKESLQSSVNLYKRQSEKRKIEQQKKMIQSQVITINHINSNKKLNQLKNKIQISKKQTEILKQHYSSHIHHISQQKQYAKSQIQDMKWALQRAKSDYQQIKNKLEDTKSDILALNEQLFISQEKSRKFEETIQQLKFQISSLMKSNLQQEQKNENLNLNLKISYETAYQLQTKIAYYQKQVSILQQKIKQNQKKFQQKIANDEKDMREQHRQIDKKRHQIGSLQLEKRQIQEMVESMKQKTVVQEKQLIQIKQELQNIKQDCIQKDKSIFLNNLEAKRYSEENDKLSNLFDQIQIKLSQQIKNSLRFKKQFDEYKKSMLEIVQIFAEEICKDEHHNVNKKSFITFSDQKMNAIMDECIKKKRAKNIQYQNKIAQLEGLIINLEEQLKIIKNLQMQKQLQFQKLLHLSQQKYQRIMFEKQSDCQKIQNKVESLEEQIIELSKQNDKRIIELKTKEEQILQLKDQTATILSDNELLKNQLVSIEQKVDDHPPKRTKLYEFSENKMSQLNNYSHFVIQQLKGELQVIQKKYENQLKMNKEVKQAIKKLQYQFNEITHQNQKNQSQKALVINKLNRSEQNLRQSEKKTKMLQKTIKQLEAEVQKIKQKQLNEEDKNKELKINIDEIYKEINQSEIEKQRLKMHQIELIKQNKELLSIVKNKSQKLKVLTDKTSLEARELKEQIINLNSNVQFKQFQLQKQCKQISALSNSLDQVRQESVRLKNDNFKKTNQLQDANKQIQDNLRNIQIIQQKNTHMENQRQNLIKEIAFLSQKLNLTQQSIQKMEEMEKYTLKIKSQLEQAQKQRQKLLNLIIKNSSAPFNNEIKFNTKVEPESPTRQNQPQAYLDSNKHNITLLSKVKSLTSLDKQFQDRSARYSPSRKIKFTNK